MKDQYIISTYNNVCWSKFLTTFVITAMMLRYNIVNNSVIFLLCQMTLKIWHGVAAGNKLCVTLAHTAGCSSKVISNIPGGYPRQYLYFISPVDITAYIGKS